MRLDRLWLTYWRLPELRNWRRGWPRLHLVYPTVPLRFRAATRLVDRLSAEEIATFTRLNQAYKDKFGFPFVICARQNKKDSILAGFARRLDNSRAEEIAAALGEIAKISYLRLLDKVATEDQS